MTREKKILRLVKYFHGGMKTITDRGANGEIGMGRTAFGYFTRFVIIFILLTLLSISDKFVLLTTKGR